MLMVVLDFEIQWYFLASDYMDGSSNFDNTQCAEMCFFAKRTLMTGQTYYILLIFSNTYNFTNFTIFSKFVTLALALWF